MNLDGASWFSELSEARPVGVYEVVGLDGTVRLVKNCVSLSPRVENLKVKKVIKVPYLNQESRKCFGIRMHVNVFTYPYISSIPIMAILQ